MTIAGSFAGETCVREDQASRGTSRLQFNRDDGLDPLGATRSCHPSQFDQLIGDEPQKSAVVRVALRRRLTFGLELGLEEKRRVYFGVHQHGTGRRKPPIEAGRPRLIQGDGRRGDVALNGEAERPRRQIGPAEGGAGFSAHG